MNIYRAARALVATLILGLAAGPLYAQDDAPAVRHGPGKRAPSMMHHGMEDPMRMVNHLGRWLELDDQQRQELENVALASEPALKTLRERARTNRESIRSLDPVADDYDVRIHELAAENGQIATEMTLLMAQFKADLHAILTPEQRQQLAAGRESMREQKRARRD